MGHRCRIESGCCPRAQENVGGILRTVSLTCPLLGTYRAHSPVSQ